MVPRSTKDRNDTESAKVRTTQDDWRADRPTTHGSDVYGNPSRTTAIVPGEVCNVYASVRAGVEKTRVASVSNAPGRAIAFLSSLEILSLGTQLTLSHSYCVRRVVTTRGRLC